ncbi:MAG: transglutaminase family protein [Gammaproteobacteria bacterium]|nr:transglutaminase family protein [Gammaproteobacteria bacterium]
MTDIWLHASCTLSFNVATPTPMVLMLRPRSGPRQWVAREEYRISPSVQVDEVTDSFGNLCQRLVAPVGEFGIYTSANVLVADQPPAPDDAPFVEVPKLPHDVLVFLLPSRYCESDRFGDMATEIVAESQPGYAQVAAITDWVRKTIRNTPGSSSYPISAIEAHERSEGVCRDLAQVAIALCRALCIPARLVVGYLHELDPMDIHAWFEAFVGGEWYTFDPANPNPRGARIAIAHGRDATDVAIYNQYGPLLLPNDMHVTVEMRESL